MVVTMHHLLAWWSFSLLTFFSSHVLSYTISTVDSPDVCNQTIYLLEGAKSAAILRLTSKDFYDTAPLNCIITFKASQHSWSGLTGVLEEVDLRRYEDTSDHHLAKNRCVDYIKVLQDTAQPNNELCGSWSVTGSDRLSSLGFRRSLFGYCHFPPDPGSAGRCGTSELRVEVSIGQQDFPGLRGAKPWRSYRGFTFVVTAYRYSFGESGCHEGLQSCGKTHYQGNQHHCVHKSLWCDNHLNCGQPKNNDELLCHNDEVLGGLMTVMVGPWVGAALLVMLGLAGVLYWRRAGPPLPRAQRQQQQQQQDHNSYAESYEVSSTMSSAHHMAIQVRVVCNSGHGLHTPRLSPWQAADLPPSYDSLFPQGPPPPKSTSTETTTTTTTSAASFNISTTSLVSTSIAPSVIPTSGQSGFYSNTTQTSSIVIPISAICNPLGSPGIPSASFNTTTTTYANTTTSVTPTVTNTTTSTTTIASVGASPAALASISVTSVSLAGPSGSLITSEEKNNNTISPSHDSRSSNSSRSPTPNICPKHDLKEISSCTVRAISPVAEPRDTNIIPSNSTGNTPASADIMLQTNLQDAAHCSANIAIECQDPLALQTCDKLSLSPSSNNMKHDLENEFNNEVASRPSTLSASCTGSYDFETSERPDSESEETEEITLEDEEASRSAPIRNSDEELSTEFNTLQTHFHDDVAMHNRDITRLPMPSDMEDNGTMHENSSDKDDESLL